MKRFPLPQVLLIALAVTTGSALAEPAVGDADEALLAPLKARGVRVERNAVIDFRADKRIDFVDVWFDQRSWAKGAELLPTLKDVGQNLALEFLHAPLTTDQLATLRGWDNLMFVTLKDCGVTDAGLAQLATLPKLRELNLSERNLTADALEPFADQKSLRTLSLEGRNFTDECLPRLTRLRGLEQIVLQNSGFTDEGLARLNKALPAAELRLRGRELPFPRWHLDRSKRLIYSLPTGWTQTRDLRLPYDVIRLPAKTERQANIIIADQPGKSALRELKEKYERDLPKSLKDFRLESSAMVAGPGGREMVKLVHTNTAPGVAVRQVNYIIPLGEKRLFVTCSAPAEDGSTHDAQFDQFARSITEPGD